MTSTAESMIAGGVDDLYVVDTDTHLTEPHDLWTSRAPKGWEERVPRARDVDGFPKWVIEDTVYGRAGGSCVVRPDGSKAYGTEFMGMMIDEIHPAAYDVGHRLAMMDEMGVHAQIVYPNAAGFGGQNFNNTIDPELRLLCVTIFNDAMAELQEESGQRIFPMALLPWWDVDAAVAEIKRTHAMGLRGVNTNSDPHNQGCPDLAERHWDPMWEACAALSMPVNFHIGASETSLSWFGTGPWPSMGEEQKLALGSTLVIIGNFRTMGNLLMSGVLERHPTLQLVSVESGLGWIPFLLESLDYQVSECAPHIAEHLSMKPSEYFRRQVHACYWFERAGLDAALAMLGPDNIMFETDFPHPTCLYPNGVTRAMEKLVEYDVGIRRQILGTNAAKLYDIPLPT